jgi:hypothetical protein
MSKLCIKLWHTPYGTTFKLQANLPTKRAE